MATTMTMAESSVQVGLPPEKARQKWTEWTKEGGPGMGLSNGQNGMPEELRNSEAGTANFEPAGGGSKVRMQLRYNPEAVKKAGQTPEWVEKRIELYLNRFKNFAEGRPA